MIFIIWYSFFRLNHQKLGTSSTSIAIDRSAPRYDTHDVNNNALDNTDESGNTHRLYFPPKRWSHSPVEDPEDCNIWSKGFQENVENARKIKKENGEVTIFPWERQDIRRKSIDEKDFVWNNDVYNEGRSGQVHVLSPVWDVSDETEGLETSMLLAAQRQMSPMDVTDDTIPVDKQHPKEEHTSPTLDESFIEKVPTTESFVCLNEVQIYGFREDSSIFAENKSEPEAADYHTETKSPVELNKLIQEHSSHSLDEMTSAEDIKLLVELSIPIVETTSPREHILRVDTCNVDTPKETQAHIDIADKTLLEGNQTASVLGCVQGGFKDTNATYQPSDVMKSGIATPEGQKSPVYFLNPKWEDEQETKLPNKIKLPVVPLMNNGHVRNIRVNTKKSKSINLLTPDRKESRKTTKDSTSGLLPPLSRIPRKHPSIYHLPVSQIGDDFHIPMKDAGDTTKASNVIGNLPILAPPTAWDNSKPGTTNSETGDYYKVKNKYMSRVGTNTNIAPLLPDLFIGHTNKQQKPDFVSRSVILPPISRRDANSRIPKANNEKIPEPITSQMNAMNKSKNSSKNVVSSDPFPETYGLLIEGTAARHAPNPPSGDKPRRSNRRRVKVLPS